MTRTESLTNAVILAIAPHVSAGQVKVLATDIEGAIKRVVGEIDAIEVEARSSHATLGQKFQAFIAKLLPGPSVPRQQVLFGQACFLAGAHSCFQVLAFAATKPQEESIVIWRDVQDEIRSAVPKRENMVELPPEKQVII